MDGRSGRDDRLGAFGGDAEPEDGAAALGRADAQGPAHGLDAGAADGEAQTRAAGRAAVVELFERLEDAFARPRRARRGPGPRPRSPESVAPSLAGRARARRRTAPSGVIFRALDSRLITTCSIRPSSARTRKSAASPSQSTRSSGRVPRRGDARRGPRPRSRRARRWASRWTSDWPDSILDRSRAPFSRRSSMAPASPMSATSSLSAFARFLRFSTSTTPMMMFSGVRTSWLIMARKRDLAWLARSAWARSASASARARSRSRERCGQVDLQLDGLTVALQLAPGRADHAGDEHGDRASRAGSQRPASRR